MTLEKFQDATFAVLAVVIVAFITFSAALGAYALWRVALG